MADICSVQLLLKGSVRSLVQPLSSFPNGASPRPDPSTYAATAHAVLNSLRALWTPSLRIVTLPILAQHAAERFLKRPLPGFQHHSCPFPFHPLVLFFH